MPVSNVCIFYVFDLPQNHLDNIWARISTNRQMGKHSEHGLNSQVVFLSLLVVDIYGKPYFDDFNTVT